MSSLLVPQSNELEVLSDQHVPLTKEHCIKLAKTCVSKTEFRIRWRKACQAANANGWLAECYTHLQSFVDRTESHCIAVAMTCRTPSEFKATHWREYDTALKKGWLNTCIAHIRPDPLVGTNFSKDDCLSVARLCRSKREFKQNHPLLYLAAEVNDWLVDCKDAMGKADLRHWTVEMCVDAARKHNNLESFTLQSSVFRQAEKLQCLAECKAAIFETDQRLRCIAVAARFLTKHQFEMHQPQWYQIASRKGWLSQCCEHMSEHVANDLAPDYPTMSPVKNPDNLSKDECIEAARSCPSLVVFMREYPLMYKKARMFGWIDECIGGYSVSISKEECQVIASRFINIRAFRFAAREAYKVAKKNDWLREFFSSNKHSDEKLPVGDGVNVTCNSTQVGSPVCDARETSKVDLLYWTKERCQEVALACTSRTDFHIKNVAAYNSARRNGWLNEVCAHMTNKRWTFDMCLVESQKYPTSTAFQEACPKAYRTALPRGWLVVFYPNEKLSPPELNLDDYRLKWTFERCMEEAKKYTNKVDFYTKSKGAYSKCITQLGWLDACCAHMTPK